MGRGYWWKSQREGDHYKDQEVGGRIIFRRNLEE
jgi:hypothetical protein